eukprot:162568_1
MKQRCSGCSQLELWVCALTYTSNTGAYKPTVDVGLWKARTLFDTDQYDDTLIQLKSLFSQCFAQLKHVDPTLFRIKRDSDNTAWSTSFRDWPNIRWSLLLIRFDLNDVKKAHLLGLVNPEAEVRLSALIGTESVLLSLPSNSMGAMKECIPGMFQVIACSTDEAKTRVAWHSICF